MILSVLLGLLLAGLGSAAHHDPSIYRPGPTTFCEQADLCGPALAPDVIKHVVQFPRVKVPLMKISYACFTFRLPTDRPYHIIATQTRVDNTAAVHHMTINFNRYQKDVNVDDSLKLCDKAKRGLKGIGGNVAEWNYGQPLWNCHPPQAGFRIGQGTSGVFLMEVHYINPDLVEGWTDSSAMVLYYTPNMRPHDMAGLELGQISMNLPPGLRSANATSLCKSECTNTILNGPIHIASMMAHTHAIGWHETVSILRPGQKETLIQEFFTPKRYFGPGFFLRPENDNYNYNYHMNPMVTVNPGDAIRTICEYQTLTRNHTTHTQWGGKGGDGEHCFASLFVWPAKNVKRGRSCLTDGDKDVCYMDLTCSRDDLINSNSLVMKPILDKVLPACKAGCTATCMSALDDVSHVDPCFGKDQWPFMELYYKQWGDAKLLQFEAAVNSCHPDTKNKP